MALNISSTTDIRDPAAYCWHLELPVPRQPNTISCGNARGGLRSRELRIPALHCFLNNNL